MPKAYRPFLTKAAALFFSLALALILAEGLLRLFGFEPWTYQTVDPNEPTVHEPDAVLGWRNMPGCYVFPAYHAVGRDVHLTFNERGQRRTRSETRETRATVLIVGGSFTQGWGVSDHETYAWQLQHLYPTVKIINCGVAGYGTYQSLLVVEKELPRIAAPKLVIYGFMEHHGLRNVAPESWLRLLSSYSRRAHVAVPFATLNANHQLVRHRPQAHLTLPLRHSLAIASLVEHMWMKARTGARLAQGQIVTEAVLLEMNKVCRQNGAVFCIALLSAKDAPKRHYATFFRQHHLPFVDCVYPMTRELIIPGEGHPNARMHELWAKRIATVLGPSIESQNLHWPTASDGNTAPPNPGTF